MWSWPNTFHFFLPELLCWTVRDYGGMSSSLLLLVLLLLLLLLVVLEIPFLAGGFVLLAAPFRQDFLCWQRLWDHGKVFGVLVVLCSNVMCLPVACTCVCGVAFLACCVVLLLSVLLLCCSLFCWVLDHVVAAVQLHESRHSSLRDSFFFWLASNLQLPVWECCTWHLLCSSRRLSYSQDFVDVLRVAAGLVGHRMRLSCWRC